MRRSALEHCKTVHRQRSWLALAKARGVPIDEQAINRFRKRLRVGGCGNSRCWLCHGDKIAGRPTLKQRCHLLTLAEGMGELDKSA